jgi:hypothetical protein
MRLRLRSRSGAVRRLVRCASSGGVMAAKCPAPPLPIASATGQRQWAVEEPLTDRRGNRRGYRPGYSARRSADLKPAGPCLRVISSMRVFDCPPADATLKRSQQPPARQFRVTDERTPVAYTQQQPPVASADSSPRGAQSATSTSSTDGQSSTRHPSGRARILGRLHVRGLRHSGHQNNDTGDNQAWYDVRANARGRADTQGPRRKWWQILLFVIIVLLPW